MDKFFIGGKRKNKKKLKCPNLKSCFVLFCFFSVQIGVCIKTWGQDLWAERAAL